MTIKQLEWEVEEYKKTIRILKRQIFRLVRLETRALKDAYDNGFRDGSNKK